MATPNVSIERSHNDNFTRVSIGDMDIYFSYETPVALAYPGVGRVKSKNIWSRTTGKHLASVNGAREVSNEAFNYQLEVLTSQIKS